VRNYASRIGNKHGQGDLQKSEARYWGNQENGTSRLGTASRRLRVARKADERKSPVTQVFLALHHVISHVQLVMSGD